jgi:hypothetical protein
VHVRNVALQRHYEARTERAEQGLLQLQAQLAQQAGKQSTSPDVEADQEEESEESF